MRSMPVEAKSSAILAWPPEPQGSGLVGCVGINAQGGIPEGAQQIHAIVEVPYARGHGPPRSDDSRHFARRLFGLGDEVQDQLRRRAIDGAGLKWNRLGAAELDYDGWVSRCALVGNDGDGSQAYTEFAPSRATRTLVSAPGPQPTSSAVTPAVTPAASAKFGQAGRVPPHE